MILRAAGSAVTLRRGRRGGGRGRRRLGGLFASASFGAAAAAAAPFASVSMIAITSFDVTVEPSGFTSSTSTPSPGAGSSSTTLSVSTSIRFSSRATASPGFLCQLTSVASATDSGSCGTFTSMRMFYTLEINGRRPSRRTSSRRANASSMSCFCSALCLVA